MEDKQDLLERITAMEVQIKDISGIREKLDSLYNLIIEMKLHNANTQSNFVTKHECTSCKKDMEKRLGEVEEGRKKLFWMSLSSGLVFMVWLIQQLLHVQIKLGG